ncbi:MAG: AAA family ATPase [Caldilineaceae bacterium]|nr:AAA family ATPase [Caldilineaceae bacterium]MBP8106506.1 AAA family ATPase [Caldilineaceae bacterium]MBP8121236.1 AAA family ATPase [Caldilineaceae bacterium]MBP9071965.1 AAA family ATPase [Caldilineaceae bacterium]
MPTLYDQLAQTYAVEVKRADRAKEIVAHGGVTVTHLDAACVRAVISGHYAVEIASPVGGPIIAQCDCPDYQHGQHRMRPCKHILALALEASGQPLPVVPSDPDPIFDPLPDPDPAPVSSEIPFREQVRRAIGRAIDALSAQVYTALAAGEVPFLIGPTGCGKTSAVRALALDRGWGFEEITGSASWADADLVGLRTDHMELPGVFARAFQRGRNGEELLLFLDEATRFNIRAMDLLMRPLQATPAAIARSMGLPAQGEVRLVEAPLWGLEWTPLEKVRLVLAANPWGAAIDPALIRRVWPIRVELDTAVASCFDNRLADAITASWSAVANGELPLPVEYQGLSSAAHPGDTSILTAYLLRLSVIDPAAAEGFKTVVKGIGLSV